MSFEAKYHGRCANDCGERIEPGDEVEYDGDDQVIHTRCPKVHSISEFTPGPKEAMCRDCWCFHAGECA